MRLFADGGRFTLEMVLKMPKIGLPILLSFFLMIIGTGSVMVCKAAGASSCMMGCHGAGMTRASAAASTPWITAASTESCCTISQTPTIDLTTVSQAQSAQPQLVLFVAEVRNHFSATNAASAHYLYSHPSVSCQSPIFILNRTLLI